MFWSVSLFFHLLFFLTVSYRFATGQVFELSLQNFDQFTKDKDVMLIEFFAPWCHHCQELAPEWEKAATALAVNREFILGKADCTGNGKELCDRFGVQMYPMIKLFRHGVFQEEYNGDRNADAIVKYLQQAQSQAMNSQPDGGWTPNNDPWQTGASFQYAYPMTTPAMNPTLQAAKPFESFAQAPIKPFVPQEFNQWKPASDRAETQPLPGPPAANGNSLWNIFNTLWNQNNYKPPAPSLFQNAIAKRPAASRFDLLQQQRPQAEPLQTRVASSSVQYQSNNNLPFQAQTSAYQLGLQNPPSANLAVPAGSVAGAYRGTLDMSNNGLGTSFIVIDGKPFAIRRVINRYNNAFTPGNMNFGRFQPFPRFGPGYLRGAAIPHVVRQALARYEVPKTALQQPIKRPDLKIVSHPPFASAFQQNVYLKKGAAGAQVASSTSNRNQPTMAAQRFLVNKPNYMQMYSNYVKALGQSIPKSHAAYPYSRKPLHFGNTLLLATKKQQTPSSFQSTNRLYPGRKYAVSIKGSPGSSALVAIRNKAVTNPGFLSGILSGRSQLYTQPKQPAPQAGPKRSKMIFNRNFNIHSPSLLNLPQTDRALIRAKIIRPVNLRAKWAARSAMTGKPRAKIVYMPSSAFKRLPTWYRPKIGPALVKYIVKTKKQPTSLLALANKKQMMMRPPVVDVWQRIYSFYNKKNAMNRIPYKQNERPQPFSRVNTAMFNRPPQKIMPVDASRPRVAVGSPILRLRNVQSNEALVKKYDARKEQSGGNFGQFAQNAPFTADAKKFVDVTQFSKNEGNGKKFVAPEFWDKRSRIRSFFISKKNTIPHRPTAAGNWGTLKKKRSARQFNKEPKGL